jgi:hypothetical protein
MRTVFNNENLAHLWANKEQSKGRNASGSMYFNNDSIYSYGTHFCIARHLNEDTILFTTRSYSNTTSKQVRIVRNAASHLNRVYCPYPEANANEVNFTYWLKEARNLTDKLIKAKKPEKYTLQLKQTLAECTKYCEALNVEIPEELTLICCIADYEDLKAFIEKEKAIILAKEKQAKIEALKAAKKSINNFRAFKMYQSYNINTGLSYLRFNTETQRIETSQRVEIPVLIAQKFYNSIKGKKAMIEPIEIMNYKLLNIDSKVIHVGCHKIEHKEINKIAKLLNW